MNKFLVTGVSGLDSDIAWEMVYATDNDRLTLKDIDDIEVTQEEQGVEAPIVFMIYKLGE